MTEKRQPLSGLKKQTPAASNEAADSFIKGAKVTDGPSVKRSRDVTFKRLTFSLTADIDKTVDRLSFMPTTFRGTRRDVVKAAIDLLESLPEDEIIRRIEAASDQ